MTSHNDPLDERLLDLLSKVYEAGKNADDQQFVEDLVKDERGVYTRHYRPAVEALSQIKQALKDEGYAKLTDDCSHEYEHTTDIHGCEIEKCKLCGHFRYMTMDDYVRDNGDKHYDR